MPKFQYKGSTSQVFIDFRDEENDHTLEAIPGEIYVIAEAPSDLFEVIAEKVKKASETPSEETN